MAIDEPKFMNEPQTLALATVEKTETAIARPAQIDAVTILEAAVRGGITSENVAVVKEMTALVERQQDRQAERDYTAALYALQQEVKTIAAIAVVDTGKGQFRFAPYLAIWRAVEGPIARHGFTLQWGQRNKDGMITKILSLAHLNGHRREFEWTIRVGSNAAGTPQGAQAPVLDEQADSRAKRRLLLDVLNITVDTSSDAAEVGTGETIDAAKSDELFKRWMAVSTNQKAFLELAGVDSWDKIRVSDLPVLERTILMKERMAKGKAGQ